MSDEINRIDIAEFRAFGYLQELNRQFLHPLGLALEIVHNDDGSESLGGVWDYRDDPEGMRFERLDLTDKARRVAEEWERMRTTREPSLGYMIQPLDDPVLKEPGAS